jgi:hypothetical protein
MLLLLLPTRSRITYKSILKFLYTIRDHVGNNNSSIVDCIFYHTKKSNQIKGGSQLEPKHIVERNSVRNTP